jgi:sigma-B regulation protein RsbU (phosphoserine phosphatase)
VYRMQCTEVWGGIKNQDRDACSSVLAVSLYSSASEGGKGGDIYYLSVCGGDQLTRVALADVRGHGQTVSRVSQWLYDTLQLRMNSGSGGEVLADLNRLVTQRGLEAMTTAAVVGVYKRNSHAYFSYAGHYPALLRRSGEPRWTAVPVETKDPLANLPLGVESEAVYRERDLPIRTGDRIVLYTDGVIEAPSRDGELFSQSRLESVLNGLRNETLTGLKDAVLAAVRDHTGGDLGHDDVTLLAIEVHH